MFDTRLLLPSSDRDRVSTLQPVVLAEGREGTDPRVAAARLVDAAGGLPGAIIRIQSAEASLPAAVEALLAPGEAAIAAADGHLCVFKPDSLLSTAWTWAEELLVRLSDHRRSPAPADRPAIGLAAAPFQVSPFELVDRAEAALRLAAIKPTRVCTWEMTQIEAAAAAIGADPTLTPDARRRRLLEQVAFTLGPTQREHLTSHCERVGNLAARIAGWLGYRQVEVERARLAGLMHDIGKAAIPEDLLAKPSALTAIERVVIDHHAAEGAVLGRKMGLDDELATCILHHHARFDDPPIAAIPGIAPAMIVGVADAFVAMTTDRSYRSACSAAAAAEELRRHRGRQFDPVVVDAAVTMLAPAAARLVA